MTDALKRLSEEGVAIWLDDLSRKRITSGNLAELIDQQHVVGVTTNPSIFQKAISSGDGYEQQLSRPRRPQGHRRRGHPHDHDGGRP
jgi:transaldolase